MALETAASLIGELDCVMKDSSSARRVEMLRRLAELFVADAEHLSERQIGVFDDVLVRLMERVDAGALAQLSTTLCGIASAPREAMRQLACHEDVAVAGPVLARSPRLTEDDMIAIASTRGRAHLLAISRRSSLDRRLTDILLSRGDREVSLALAGNAGARFSAAGHGALTAEAARHATLAEVLKSRADLPGKAELPTAGVAGPPETARPNKLDFTGVEGELLALNRAGKLTDQAVKRFTVDGQLAKTVASIAMLTSVSTEAIEQLLRSPVPRGLAVACRAARLSWPATVMILRNRPSFAGIATEDLGEAQTIFDTLPLSVAQNALRVWEAQSPARRAASDPTRELPSAANDAVPRATSV